MTEWGKLTDGSLPVFAMISIYRTKGQHFFHKANPTSGSFPIGFAVLLPFVCCRAVRKSESGVPVAIGFPQLRVLPLACSHRFLLLCFSYGKENTKECI